MESEKSGTRARLALVIGGDVVPLGTVGVDRPCDLDLVDRLLRLQLIALRNGWRLRVSDVEPRLRELIDLVGVTDVLDG